MELKIDRYEIQRLVGQGAMGRIYLAIDPKLGREVAIKVLSSNTDPEVRDRFRLEARAIAALKHPNIVELYDYSGERAEDLFLVMEYVRGRTLHDHIIERGAMSEATALCVAHEIALALIHAHDNKVVHRDIKPENVLLFQGRVVLTDFGIVKQIAAQGALGLSDVQTRTQALGTPGFMSPEQFGGGQVTTRSDIFSLGALLYNVATGNLPFPGDSLAEVIERVQSGVFEDPRSFNPVLSDSFCEIVNTCLKNRPRDRYESSEALRHALIEALRFQGVTEVRAELLGYERNPSTYAFEQRERGLEVLMRDLKLAIKDRDEPGVQAIARRMRTIAPLTEKIRGVTGIHWDANSKPRLTAERAPANRWPWLMLGFGVGGLLGAFTALLWRSAGLLPQGLIAFFDRLAMSLGLGF